MTAVSLGGAVMLPSVASWQSADASITLDAAGSPDNGVAGDYFAFVIKVPETGTIDAVTIRVGTTAATGGDGTLSCRLFSLDSAGDPDDDAVYGSCTQVNVAITGTDDNTFKTFNGLACSATRGDVVAVTVWLSALVTTCSVGIVYQSSVFQGATPASSFPYITTRTTGTGAGTKANVGYGLSLAYSGGARHEIGILPAGTTATESLDADGSLRRAGNIFILPIPVTAFGVWVVMDNDTDTTTVKLYDIDGTTVLATATELTANRQSTAAGWHFLTFAAAVNLLANTATGYRVVVETNNTSSTAVICRKLTVSAAADWNQVSMGEAWYYTSHNGTAWTNTTTARAAVGLMVSKLDDGAGGGGGGMLRHPGMAGGLNG